MVPRPLSELIAGVDDESDVLVLDGVAVFQALRPSRRWC